MSVYNYIYDNPHVADIDLFNKSINRWDLQFRQLEKGKLKGSYLQFIKPGLLFGHVKLDKQVEHAGTSPYGHWTFAFMYDAPIIWKGTIISDDELIILKPGDEINGVGQLDFKVLTLSIPEEVLERVCEENDLTSTMKIIRENDLIRVDKSKLYRFNSFLLELINQIRLNPSSTNAPGFLDLWDQVIPIKLCQLIEGPGLRKKVFTSPQREIIIKKANQYITDMLGDLVSISDLCRITNTSERTLQYTFKEYYGMSPKAYLKARILNEVHTALRLADPNTTKVIDIAYQYGFWHMGQFAADYKRMFGKLPSETLNRV